MPELPFPDPPLRAAEVALRPLADSDREPIAAACQDPDIPRWTHVPSPYSADDARAFLDHAERSRREGSELHLAVTAAGSLAGTVGLTRGAEPGVAEIGYWIAAPSRRRGLATAAVRLLSRWALRELGLERLELMAHPGNQASQRVALAAGFTREGVLRRFRERKGEREDLWMFSLLPADLGTVHPRAASGFSRAAGEYERARPGYPAEAVDWLAERLGLGRGRTVVDLAAGTGKLTRLLVPTGARVVAVEPLAEMRARIEPPAEAVEGTAEDLPLPDASADAATVAQAFHWFDFDAALAEILRVLRPGGRLGLIWNRRGDFDPANVELERLIAPHRGDTPSHRGAPWREAFERSAFGPPEQRSFDNPQRLDAAALGERVASISFIATLPEDERAAVVDAARALASAGPVTLSQRTEVAVCAAP